MISDSIKLKVDEYVAGVLNEDIIVCNSVRQAVARYVNDLERVGDHDFPYYFSQNVAASACDFFPLFLRHSIGDYQGQPFNLESWQAFAIWNIFGWRSIHDDTRRFRKVYWGMARKNGKSTIAAGIAIFMAMMDLNPVTKSPEAVAEVLLCATKREQVEKVIYAEIGRMRACSPYIAQRSEEKNKQITFAKNLGNISCLSSDKRYDGRNPSCVVLDELHAWRPQIHQGFFDTMMTGSGSRSQPLTVMTTTAGEDTSEMWKEEYFYGLQVLAETVRDERLFFYSFELDKDDDMFDEDLWIKANPNLNISVKKEYLQSQAAEATVKPSARQRFEQLHVNRMTLSAYKAFDLNAWDACAGELSDWKKADARGGGFDLGGRDDLASVSLVARFRLNLVDTNDNPLYRYEIKSWSFIASDTLRRDLTQQPFAKWIYDGHLLAGKHPIRDLKETLLEECGIYHVAQIAYDPWTAQGTAEDLEAAGLTVARMAQSQNMQNEPILDFTDAMLNKRLVHNGDPVLRWAINNAVLSTDRVGKVMLDKRASREKIDPVVSCVMAFRMAMLAPATATGPLYIC